jgi:hypothetical protein
MSACANPKCPAPARHSVKVWSWFKTQRDQTPLEYLVCAGCADEFFPNHSGRFDRAKRELLPLSLLRDSDA